MLNSDEKVVVVAGGGYAGVLAANRVHGRLRRTARIILIAPGSALTDRIRLHEVAARGGDVRRPYAELLAAGVERVDGRVVGLDPESQQLRVAQQGSVQLQRYDAVILALGSQFVAQESPASPHASALHDVERAQALAAALRALSQSERVVVVGGGLSAIELGAELADAHPRLRIELVAQQFGVGLTGPAADALRQGLASLGVSVREGRQVVRMTADEVELDDGTRLSARISVRAAGMRASPLGPDFPIAARPDGRIAVDAQLRVEGLPNVFVAGDLAAPPSAAIGRGLDTTRMACATAMPLGAHCADQVVRLLRGRPLEPYRFGYVLQCISLGRRNGVVVFVDRDDRPSGRLLRGRKAALVKELICRFVVGALRLERFRAGSYAWAGSKSDPPALRSERLSA